jgi:hypothetical protein
MDCWKDLDRGVTEGVKLSTGSLHDCWTLVAWSGV